MCTKIVGWNYKHCFRVTSLVFFFLWGLDLTSAEPSSDTLPETNNFAPENWWLEDDPFLLGPGLFSGAMSVSFREASWCYFPPKKSSDSWCYFPPKQVFCAWFRFSSYFKLFVIANTSHQKFSTSFSANSRICRANWPWSHCKQRCGTGLWKRVVQDQLMGGVQVWSWEHVWWWFHPNPLGKDPILMRIFWQMGWKRPTI